MLSAPDIYMIIKELSSTSRMSLRRVVKMAYLLDWHMEFRMGIHSDHRWTYGVCGPADATLEETIRSNSDMFELRNMDNHYGGTKQVVLCHKVDDVGDYRPCLLTAIDNVRARLYDIPWTVLARIVSSTYPMSKYHPGEVFDLQECAREYNELLRRREEA